MANPNLECNEKWCAENEEKETVKLECDEKWCAEHSE